MMEKIKIAYVVTNLKKTGPINQTLNIIKNLDRNAFEPSIITLWNETPENSMIGEYKNQNVPIYTCELTKYKSVIWGTHVVKKILDKIKPHIIQAVGMPPYRMIFKYKKAIPYVVLRNYCYEDYPSHYGKNVGKFMAFFDVLLIKKQIKKGFPITTCSKSLSEIYKQKETVDIPYIQNGVDIGKYNVISPERKNELRKEVGFSPDKIIFIYSGRFIERKNQTEVIEAFQKVGNPNIQLVFLGDGPNKKGLMDKTKGMLNIVFLGNVTNIQRYLQAGNVYISSSKSEGLPNGVLEAMACGLPVVLSNIPQHKEVLDDDVPCGYVYELGSTEDLREKIEFILQSNRKIMGENAYKRVRNNFSDIEMSRKYAELYKKVCKQYQK